MVIALAKAAAVNAEAPAAKVPQETIDAATPAAMADAVLKVGDQAASTIFMSHRGLLKSS